MASEQMGIGNSGDTSWSWQTLEPEPTPAEREMLDRFSREYLVDNNQYKAASRCGFQAPFNVEYGDIFIRRSYVQRKLQELRLQVPDASIEEQYNRRLVFNTFREIAADTSAPHAARVSAAAKLAEMHGFIAQASKEPANKGARGGVVVVPGIANVSDWEAAAMPSQKALAEASRVD